MDGDSREWKSRRSGHSGWRKLGSVRTRVDIPTTRFGVGAGTVNNAPPSGPAWGSVEFGGCRVPNPRKSTGRRRAVAAERREQRGRRSVRQPLRVVARSTTAVVDDQPRPGGAAGWCGRGTGAAADRPCGARPTACARATPGAPWTLSGSSSSHSAFRTRSSRLGVVRQPSSRSPSWRGRASSSTREAGDLCRYAYEVIVAALDDGALDGWLAGWDYQATSILHLRKALLERDDLDRSTYGRVAHVADDGAAVVVKWCRDHPVLDAPGLASSSA